ncbi:endo-beta-N-acetylglucosaminidase [Mycena floridula]|nr:endo-beta-N-acetylglucosaminidase [Mycena floridula]
MSSLSTANSHGHRIAVYYQTQYDNSLEPNSPFGHYVTPLPLLMVITHLILAAFHINMNSSPVIALNDNSPDDVFFSQMWTDIGILQDHGIKVIGMLGGAAPGSYDCLTPENFDTYYPILKFYITQYKLDGMDLDVEQTVAIEDIIRLILTLKKDFGPDFIITLAPVASALTEDGNLSGFDYIELEHNVGSHIDWYNAQFYSGFGSLFPDDTYIDIVRFGLDPKKLVATTLTNPELGGGYQSPEDVVESVKELVLKYGDSFGGVAGWEYFDSLPGIGQPWQWAVLMGKTMKNPRLIER